MTRTSKLLLLFLPLLALSLTGCSLLGPLLNLAVPAGMVKLHFACVPEHTPIDTPTGPRLIEELEPGDTVIGFTGQPVRVQQKHVYLEHSETIFLHVTFSGNASVDVCGMHRIMGIRAQNLRQGQTVAGHQVLAIEPHSGVTRSFDLLTEDAGYRMNGIPVNSMIEEMQHAAAYGLQSVKP